MILPSNPFHVFFCFDRVRTKDAQDYNQHENYHSW